MTENDDMDSLLKNIGCEDLTAVFKDNHIDINNFVELTDDELKELIPSIGQRKKIKNKISEILAKSSVTYEQIEYNSKTIGNNSEGSLPSTVTVPSTSSATELIEISDVSIESDNGSGAELSNDLEGVVDLFFSTVKPRLPDFDLATLLQTSPLGNSILSYYNVNSRLDNTHRTRLVDIITKHIYTYIINYRLKENDYLVLAAKIISLFPNEVVGTYYVPPIKKKDSRTGKSVLAKGRLISKVNNFLNISGDAVRVRKRKSEDRNNDDSIFKKPNIPSSQRSVTNDEYKNNPDVVWLLHNNEPWATVLEKWSSTYNIRRAVQCSTITDFINKWPVLKDLRSDVLITQDFEKLYPESALNFYTNWSKFFSILLELNEKGLKDESIINLVKLWRSCDSEDGKRALELNILPYLIPPKGRLIIDKHTHWKFSILEVVESIIVHVKTPGDISTAIAAQIEKAANRKQTVQPYLIIEGPTLYNPRCFYVVIDTLKYQLEELGKAFDILFKSFHTLHAKYPVQSEYLYTVIQKCVYGITSVYDKITPSTEEIIHLYTKKIINQAESSTD